MARRGTIRRLGFQARARAQGISGDLPRLPIRDIAANVSGPTARSARLTAGFGGF